MGAPSNAPGPRGHRLARAFDWGAERGRLWEPGEYRAVFEHLLRSPIEFDVDGLESGLGKRLRRLSEAEGLLLKSFGELLQHPCPPLELLELTKEWAKANREDADSWLPGEIAGWLYYACIAAALARFGRRITSLDDRRLRAAFAWAGAQPWITEDWRVLFSAAEKRLAESNQQATPGQTAE